MPKFLTKVCCNCKQKKTIDNFTKWNKAKDGYRPRCRSCVKEQKHKYYLKQRRKKYIIKRYYEIKKDYELQENQLELTEEDYIFIEPSEDFKKILREVYYIYV